MPYFKHFQDALHGLLRIAAVTLVVMGRSEAGEPPRSDASDTPLPGVVRSPLPMNKIEGRPLALVFYDLQGTAGITGGDDRARLEIEEAFGIRAGMAFNIRLMEIGLLRVQKLPFVRDASCRTYESGRPGHVVLVLSVTLGPKDAVAGPRGMMTGRAEDLPVLFQNERSMLRLNVDGGFGLFADYNPWFGNTPAFTGQSPVAVDPADGDRATWFEAFVEYGPAGVVQVGDGPVWVYGALTWLTSFSSGQDLFRSDTRNRTEVENAYGGVVFQPPNSDWVFNASAGRQSWQLNDGFLFSEFAAAANAGPMPALYLNPRTAYEMTGLFRAKRRGFQLEAFYLDPSEIDFLDSNTAFAGINLSQQFTGGWEGSVAYYECVDSDTTFTRDNTASIPREGQQTANLRVSTTRLFSLEGLEGTAEGAYQTSRDVDWDAWAYYARIGYTFGALPWEPNLSYRYASFSGDDPSSSAYERFDAPLSSGLDDWVQGIVAKKVVSNSNLDSHRVRLNLVPHKSLSFTFDYFYLMANEPAGGAHEYAQEADLGIRWSINRNLFFLGVAGIAFPGDRLKEQSGGDLDTWSTLQASLFWAF